MSAIAGLLTVAEVASILDVSSYTVQRYCQQKRLAAQLVSGVWLIEESAVKKFKRPQAGNPNWIRKSNRKRKGH